MINATLMIKIYNNIIPFKGYKALVMWPLLFVRKGARFGEVDERHEKIHGEQQKKITVRRNRVTMPSFTSPMVVTSNFVSSTTTTRRPIGLIDSSITTGKICSMIIINEINF